MPYIIEHNIVIKDSNRDLTKIKRSDKIKIVMKLPINLLYVQI